MGIMRTLTINGSTFNVVPVVPATSVTLLASAWTGSGDAYFQVVELAGVTANTKVDLQPTAEQLQEFHYKVLGFVAENEAGVVTVYSIGDKPTSDHTIQVTLTEVEGTGRIRGNTVGTTMPRANLEQEDPRKADYVVGREAFLSAKTAVSYAPQTLTDEQKAQARANIGVGAAERESQDTVTAISITEEANGIVFMVNTLESGGTETIAITPDENGNPASVSVNGTVIPISWVVSA